MSYAHGQPEFASFQGELSQPLIGVMAEEGGQAVVRYFTEEQDAERGMGQDTSQEALSLAGVWRDLDWDELAQALARIRHDSQPTHVISRPNPLATSRQ